MDGSQFIYMVESCNDIVHSTGTSDCQCVKCNASYRFDNLLNVITLFQSRVDIVAKENDIS